MKAFFLFCYLALSVSVLADSSAQEIKRNVDDGAIYYRATHHPIPTELIERTGVPTHIVRMNIDLRGRKTTCEQAIDALGKILVRPLQSYRFIFSVVGLCTFDQRGDDFASAFLVRAEIDPVDTEAAIFLKDFVAERNQTEFLGRIFLIEEAEGLVVSLAVEIGIKDANAGSAFRRLRRYAIMHYFESYFDVVATFYVDTDSHFLSQNPDFVLPYYEHWFDIWPTEDFKRLLREANYIELPVKHAYLMKKGERVYFPPWSATFFNRCYFFENKHCLL